MRNSVTWQIGGEAGFGIISAGTMFARTFTRTGYFTFTTNDYPSLIRGGHNVVKVRIATKKFMGMNRDLHLLVALNAESVEKHVDALSENALVMYDPKDKEWVASDFPKPVHLLPVPLREIIANFSADIVMRNTVALGASVALLGAPFESFVHVLEGQFLHKGQEVVDENVKIAKAGYDYVKEHFAQETSLHLDVGTFHEKIAIVNGSEALGLGAVGAGLKFAAIYPMTPINSLITFLADHAKSLGLVYKQPEDEIAGINMAIGASVAGVRSMVATSGGGFALQVEGLSLAGMIEVPLVIDMGMRVGPATGMPTYTEQGELLFVTFAGHGDFPRIVLAPGDAEEAYSLTRLAFEMADKYQIPVFVLTDKYLNESQWSLPVSILEKPVVIDRGKLVLGDTGKADGEFQRYDPTVPDGVSLRSVPGTKNGVYYANSYEHDGTGHMTDTAEGRVSMSDKRLRKAEAMKHDIPVPPVFGDLDADVTLVCWGSTKGAVLTAMEMLRANGKKVSVLYMNWLFPFPSVEVASVLARAKRVIDVEQNATAQLATLIRMSTGIDIKEKILKYDGRPLLPEEVIERIGDIS